MPLPPTDRDDALRLLRGLAPWLAALFLALPIGWCWSAETHALERSSARPGGAVAPAAFPLDDAYIYQVYGRHLARGGGYAFREGEPDSAATALLWALCVGGLHAFVPLDPLVATQLLGTLLAFLACGWTGTAVARWTGSAFAGATSSLALAWTPRVAWGALAGMDPPLTLALIAGGCAAAARERPGWLAHALFAAAGFSRPEAFLVLPLVASAGAATWLVARVRGVSPERRAPAGALVRRAMITSLLALAGYALANVLLAGDPLPSTFRAKVGPAGLLDVLAGKAPVGPLLERLAELPWQVWFFLWQDLGLLLVPALCGLVLLGPAPRSPVRPLLPLLLLVYPVAKTLFAPSFNDLLFQYGRQGAVLSLAGAAGLGALVAGIGRSGRPLLATAGAALLPLASAVWWIAPPVDAAATAEAIALARDAVWSELRSLAPWIAATLLAAAAAALGARRDRRVIVFPVLVLLACGLGRQLSAGRDLASERAADVERIVHMHVGTALWLAANTPPGASVGANDIGAIAFYSQRRIVDLFGLIDARILPYRRHSAGGGGATHAERSDLHPAFLLEEGLRCDYLAVFPDWFPGLLADLAAAGPGQIGLDGGVLHQVVLPANPTTGSTLKIVVRLRYPE